MTTWSPAAGTPEGDQVLAVLQLPEPVEVLVTCAKLADTPISRSAKNMQWRISKTLQALSLAIAIL
jgi:hypothetical protein